MKNTKLKILAILITLRALRVLRGENMTFYEHIYYEH